MGDLAQRREGARAPRERLALLLLAGPLLLTGCLGGSGYTPIHTAFNKGVYQYSKGNYEAAVAEYREALSEDPDDHRSRFNLALALEALAAETKPGPEEAERRRRLLEEAETNYREILRLRPNDVRATVNLAAMERDRGDRSSARERLERAIQEHPRLALPRASLAAQLLSDGQHAESYRLLREARDLEPADLMTNALLGDAAVKLGKLDEARAAYTTVLARDETDPEALLALGRLESEAGDRAAALDYFRRAALADPGSFDAHLRLSELYARDDSTLEEATRHLWTIRRMGAGDPAEIRAKLLDLYRRLAEREGGSR